MFKGNCVVKYVEKRWSSARSQSRSGALFEAAVRGLYRLDSSFSTEEDVFDRTDVTVEVHEEPTTQTRKIERLRHPD